MLYEVITRRIEHKVCITVGFFSRCLKKIYVCLALHSSRVSFSEYINNYALLQWLNSSHRLINLPFCIHKDSNVKAIKTIIGIGEISSKKLFFCLIDVITKMTNPAKAMA